MTKSLTDIYATVPDIECKGLCHGYCGPIEMSGQERQKIRSRGVEIKPALVALREGVTSCPALTFLGRCSVYEDRPLICRLWGVTDGLPCEYGCKPIGGRYLTNDEAHALIRQAEVEVP